MQSRLKSKVVTYMIISSISGLVVWAFHIYLNNATHSENPRMLHKESHNPSENLEMQVANLKNKYSQIQETIKHELLQPSNIEKQLLESFKKASAKLQEEIESLQHQLKHARSSYQVEAAKPFDKVTSTQDFTRRKQRVNYVCSTGKVQGSAEHVLTHNSGVIYCIVPKAGCTFWKRIFTAVTHQDNVTLTNINSISRDSVHNPIGNGFAYNENFTTALYPTRLIVTRDPYSRLLSSYLDKAYLPDFWLSEIAPMIQKRPTASPNKTSTDFLRQHFDTIAVLFKDKNVTSETKTAMERRCGKYMTFSEFVESSFDRNEPHWMPIHQICNPCVFNVTHVSSMETFTQDARVILSHMKLERLLDDFDENMQIDEEIRAISSYNFNHFNADLIKTFYRSCITHREIAYRLWHNFRWRGYIDPDIEYIIPEFKNDIKVAEDFMIQVWAARKSGIRNPKRMKTFKNEFKQAAFATISKSMFLKLSKKYDLDFQLFGFTDVRDEMYNSYNNN